MCIQCGDLAHDTDLQTSRRSLVLSGAGLLAAPIAQIS